ncbi:hypothetical protein E2C01_038729 [Portunus trituberculatus]|uniref:Uncharacterized protein n=1 Tax=Portunus trituberculatus TaxID=210409 RepID=A0A5B7FHJ3_PORTR|nr:hypothetical protein [Portunus trituberculatus]
MVNAPPFTPAKNNKLVKKLGERRHAPRQQLATKFGEAASVSRAAATGRVAAKLQVKARRGSAVSLYLALAEGGCAISLSWSPEISADMNELC